MRRAKRRDLEICAHVILGLPGEKPEDMFDTAGKINDMAIHGIKIHPFHVCRDTVFAKDYYDGKIETMTENEYVKLVCDFLERINPEIMVHRLTAQAPYEVLVAPEWILEKAKILNLIHVELDRRDSYQGMRISMQQKR